MPPLRVLTAAPLPPTYPGKGGIEEYAYAVVGAQRSQGVQVTVVSTRLGPGDRPDANLELLPGRMLLERPLVLDPRAFARLFRLARNADVIHVHMPYPGVEAFLGWAARLLGKPYVVTYHMDAILDEWTPTGWRAFVKGAVERLYGAASVGPALACADVVCTNTEAYARGSRFLARILPKVTALHQGIDRAKFDQRHPSRGPAIRESYLANRYRALVVYVGRFVPYKGIEYLVEAADRMRDSGTLFVLGGSGPLQDRIAQRVAELDLSNVRLIGYVPDAELMDLFAAADVVVAPSVSVLESTPITLLYAMALGTRVIGTTVGGTAETVPSDGVRGCLVAPRDVEALVEAIRHLLAAPSGRPFPAAPRFWSDVAGDYSSLMSHLREASPLRSPIASVGSATGGADPVRTPRH
jgi:glycosyltransferase involved in cell wall biosynthesis